MKRANSQALILSLFTVFLFSGCKLIPFFGSQSESDGESLVAPLAAPVNAGGSHVVKGEPAVGPYAKVDHGPAGNTLLSDYMELTNQLKEQQARITSIEDDLKRTRVTLEETKKAYDAERLLRVGIQAERDETRDSLKEREIHLLTMALERTHWEKRYVELKINFENKSLELRKLQSTKKKKKGAK